jgi:hypothetical protein
MYFSFGHLAQFQLPEQVLGSGQAPEKADLARKGTKNKFQGSRLQSFKCVPLKP